MTTFAERLRTLRRDAGLSQTQLAGDGISPSYISLLESGRRHPSAGVAAQLAAKLGCSVSQLLDGEPSEHERRVQLELAYAELALRHDGAEGALTRLQALLAETDLAPADASAATVLLARAQEHMGDVNAAVATLTPLLDRARAGEAGLSLPRIATHLCHCHVQAGDLTRTVGVGEQALANCREQGLNGTDEYFMLAATVMMAYADLGDESHAAAWARHLIAEAETAGSRGGQAALYWNAALLAERDGRLDDALHLSRRALAHLGELGDSRDLARLKLDSATVLLATDPPHLDEARTTLDRAKGELRRLGSELDLVWWGQLRSTVALLQMDAGTAEDFAREAIDHMPEDGTSEQLSLAHRALGDALSARGRRTEAMDNYITAADLHAMANPGRGTALGWRDIAERLRDSGDIEAAMGAYRSALDAAGVRDRTKAVLAAVHELESRTGAARTVEDAQDAGIERT